MKVEGPHFNVLHPSLRIAALHLLQYIIQKSVGKSFQTGSGSGLINLFGQVATQHGVAPKINSLQSSLAESQLSQRGKREIPMMNLGNILINDWQPASRSQGVITSHNQQFECV